MKKHYLIILCLSLFTLKNYAQNVSLPPSGDNQKCVVTQYMGPLVSVSVTYNSPDVTSPSGEDRRGKIWGDLVPYGMNDLGFGLRQPAPWRAGANENTTVSLSHDVLVQGKPLKAGTYGFHIIVNETGPWTLIFSKVNSAWGSYFYQEKDDALRVESSPIEAPYHEWLSYEFTDRQPASCELTLFWENIGVPVRIEVPDMNQVYLDNMRKELLGGAGFYWNAWNAAADFCLRNNVNLEEGLEWAEKAISEPWVGQENFTTFKTKADILSELGRTAEAASTMEKAINHPSTTAFEVHNYGRQLIDEGKKAEALQVFKLNAERFDGAWPVNVGLARGYSALGEYQKALLYVQTALEQAPDDMNRASLKKAIEKLKAGEDMN